MSTFTAVMENVNQCKNMALWCVFLIDIWLFERIKSGRYIDDIDRRDLESEKKLVTITTKYAPLKVEYFSLKKCHEVDK